MSVITKQTLILKTCGDLSQSTLSDNFFAENGAFLNFSVSGNKANAKLTFIKKPNFKNAALVLRFNRLNRIFALNDLNGERSTFDFDFNVTDILPDFNENNKNSLSALVMCGNEPRFFACSPKNDKIGETNRRNALFTELKELKNFYEKNNTTNGERVAENETRVFRQEEMYDSANRSEADGETFNFGKKFNDDAFFVAENRNEPVARTNRIDEYDDEAVATENYYELNAANLKIDEPKSGEFSAANKKIPLYKADEIINVNIIEKENDNDEKRGYKPVNGTFGDKTPNEYNLNDKEKNQDDLQNSEDARTFNSDAQNETKKATQSRTDALESGAYDGKSENAYFYHSVKEDVEKLFKKYPPEPALNELVPDSRWVKINYGKGKHYVVGVINFNGLPAHIAYGIAGNRKFRPNGMGDYSLFLPASQYSLTDEGYWCMLQSAKTGKTEK